VSRPVGKTSLSRDASPVGGPRYRLQAAVRDDLAMSERGFAPGDRVILKEDGTAAIVRWSTDGYSAVNWLDEDPEELGGSCIANDRLRLQDQDSSTT
jgi:hypothetical protein